MANDTPKIEIGALLNFAKAKQEIKTQLDTLVKDFQEQAKVEMKVDFSEKDAKILFNQFEKDATKSAQTIKKQLQDATTLNLNKNKFGTQLDAWVASNTKAIPKLGSKIEEIKAQIQSADKVQLGNLQKEFQTVNKQAEALGIRGKTLGQQLRSDLGNFATFLFGGGLIIGSINTVKSMISSVTELNTSMVELRKVTDLSEASYEKFYTQANQTAKSLGATTKSVIDATATWAQMGYSIQDAAELAKDSEIFSNISENMNVEDATSTLISSIKAFGLDANDVLEGVVSKINEVGNRFAVTNSDVADVLKRSASAMADANNTMEQTIALGTAAVEITRDSESAGTALKTNNCLYVQKCA